MKQVKTNDCLDKLLTSNNVFISDWEYVSLEESVKDYEFVKAFIDLELEQTKICDLDEEHVLFMIKDFIWIIRGPVNIVLFKTKL
jgi:hypothetical protein